MSLSSKDKTDHEMLVKDVVSRLGDNLSALGAGKCGDYSELCPVAEIICDSMTLPSRFYHSINHAIDVASRVTHPIQVLAALFHDVVYCFVDGGLTTSQKGILEGIFEQDGEPKWKLCQWDPKKNSMEARIASIFGFRSGRELSDRDGLNEFLSSILAVRLLDDFLDENDLVRIAVCIEATIPFRPVDSVGNTPMERLHHRLVHTNTEYASVLSKQEMIEAVQLAAGLANADNWHFCSKNFKEKSGFLKGSFLLLPEWNANLRDDATCTISDFHQELYKFHTMCIHTDPSRIFSSFNNVPDEETLSDMTEKAKENVSLALRFIRIKLVSVSVLLACALETGGDIPTKAFRTAFTAPPDLPSYSLSSSIDSELHELLACSQDFSFDPISSSLAAGVYKILGNDGTEDIMRSVDSLYPITKETSAALLASCLSSIVDLFVRYLDKADHKRHAELVKLLARFARN